VISTPYAPEQPAQLVGRREDGVGRRIVARHGHSAGDEQLLEAGLAERDEHPGPLGADEVGVLDPAWGEAEVAGREVDPLAADENRHLALEDV
jgi:hypothetical protein